jgi:hypothetical protein
VLSFIAHYGWLSVLILIPIIPRVKVGTAVNRSDATNDPALLLDDVMIFAIVGLGLFKVFTRASVTGDLKVGVSRFGLLFGGFVLYKLVGFLLLALVFPWNFHGNQGYGVSIIEGSLVLVKTVVFLFVYLTVFIGVDSYKDIRVTVKVFITCTALVVAVGFGQFFILGHPILTSTFRNVHELGLIQVGVWGLKDPWFGATAVGHEHLGAFMILAQALIAGFLLCHWPAGKMARRMLLLLWLCCLFVLVFASSRGAWIGGIFSFAALLWGAWKLRRLHQVALTVLFGLVLVWLLLELSGFDIADFMEARVKGFEGALSGGKIEDNSAINRLLLFQILWNRFLENPLVGWGAGGAGLIAEGQFIRELVEGGVIGLIWFCAMIAVCCRLCLRLMRRASGPFIKGLAVGFFAGIVGICGQSLFTELLILTKVGAPFWCIAAIVHRAYELESRNALSTGPGHAIGAVSPAR